jgi:subtilase family serine protease
VNESSLTTLKGNVPRLARAESDRGEASPATQLTHIRLVLSRSSEQQAALDEYLAELQDKSSPNYHKWLTPDQFGQLYGPADSDIAALVAWLQSHGLTVESISKGRTNIAFSGMVSQVEEAFHTSIHSFQANQGEANGRQFYSNITDPQIPSALAAVVKGVAHLNTIEPRPQFVRGNAGRINPETGRLEPLSAGASTEATPYLTSGSSYLYIVPADAATIYDTPNSFNANFSSGTSYTGAGVKIGIGGNATISASIVGNYRSTFLGSSTVPTLNYCTSSTSCSTTAGSGYVSGDADEAYLDTEISGGLAPGATIYYYASADLNTGIEAAIDANLVDIFSLSFGECEQNMSTSDNAQINGWWEQAAGQGIAVTISSGDSGSAACDGDSGNTVASHGLSVNGLASTPYDIAVGGTDLSALKTSFSSYADTSKGTSSTYYRTALKYISESAWNDSSLTDTTISANVPSTKNDTSGVNIVAGGGGHSSCSTNNSKDNTNGTVTDGSCISGYSKPSWQSVADTIFDSDGVRDIPDVSLMSGNGYDAATWLVCDSSENCSNISGNNFDGYGGTSTAAPAFAGILALVEQKTGNRLGQAAETLYELYNGSYSSSIFHDVTVGNNSVPCSEGTTDCDEDSSGYYFESGYDTGSGYDLATGLGSVDATTLMTYWSTVTGAGTTYFLSATTPASISPGGTAVSTVTVTAEGGYAGTVTLSCALTTYPTGATDLPSCSGGSTTVTLSSGTTSGQATVTVSTTAATTGALVYPKKPGQGSGLWGAGGGAVLALVAFVGIPARRRSWRSMLGVLVAMAALGGLSACNSGAGTSGSSGSSGTSSAGTTAGTYTFTVTGTGNDAASTKATTTFTVTVK